MKLLRPAAVSAALAFLLMHGLLAQPRISGRISGGFQAPTSTDDQGRRHVLKGTTAEPRGDNLYELTDPRVISYDANDSPELFIEAPRCFYNMRQNLAYSDAALTVQTPDGKFSLEGLGWHWNPEAAYLVISNQVVALVQKSALSTNISRSMRSQVDTNAPVRITARSFTQEGDGASFLGDVLVRDGDDTLRCDRLNLEFAKPDGLQSIEALENVEFRQEQAIVRSAHATYNFKDDTVRISGKPEWESEGRTGRADLLVFDRSAETLAAEGHVYMKLPLTNVTETAIEADAGTNRFLQVYSDKFRFEDANSNRLARAFYEGNVRVLYTDAAVSSGLLTVGFNASNRVNRVLAEQDVVIESDDAKVFGERADYNLEEEKIVLTRNPRWEMDRTKGQSDTLVFFPTTREVLALSNVEMILPGQSAGAMFGVNTSTNQAATESPIVVRAESFSRGTNVATFNGNVVVADPRGRLSCETVTIVTGASNQVQQIVAENSVRIEQQGFVATGASADYNVATGLVHLTGSPELTGEDKRLRAEGFVIDRNRNTFSVVPGKYRIEMKMKPGSRELSIKR